MLVRSSMIDGTSDGIGGAAIVASSSHIGAILDGTMLLDNVPPASFPKVFPHTAQRTNAELSGLRPRAAPRSRACLVHAHTLYHNETIEQGSRWRCRPTGTGIGRARAVMLFGQHVLPLILATSACAAAFSLDIASLKRAREKRELSHLCTTTQDCNYCNNYCNSQAMEVCHGRVCYPQPPASPPPSLPLPPKPPPSQPPCPPPPAILVVESVTSPPAVPPRLDIPIYWAGITPSAGAGGSNSSGEPIADVGQALTAPGGAGTLSYNHSAGLEEAGFSFRSVGDAHGASSAQLDENAHNDSGGLHVGGVLLYVFGSVLLLGIAYLAYIYKPWEKVKGTKYDVFSQPLMAFEREEKEAASLTA